MNDTRDPPDGIGLIEAVAAAIREELGAPIEEQPGFHGPDEAWRVNRAFRVVVRTVLRPGYPTDLDLATAVGDVLRRLARRRLERGPLDAREVEHLLCLESHGRDDRLTCPILTPRSEIEHVFETCGPDGD